MGVLRPVVHQILRPTVLHAGYQPAMSHPVATQFVGDQHPRHVLQTGEQLPEEPGSGLGVAAGGDQDVQDVAVLVHRPPKIMNRAVDLDEHLVEVPLVPRTCPAPTQSVDVGLAEFRVSICKKSTARTALAWAVRNWRQVGPDRRSAGSIPASCRNLPHRGDGDAMTEAEQLARHPPVSPGGILGSHPNDHAFDRRSGWRTSRSAVCGVVPCPRGQPAVPGQDRGGSDREDRGPAAARQEPGQGRQPRPVAGV